MNSLAWAKEHDLSGVLDLVRNLVPHPLIVVASGGSITAADLMVRLHQTFARLPAVVLTPYEFTLRPSDDVSGVLLISAGGSDPDILGAARHAAEASRPVFTAIIGRVGSPLASQMRDCRHAHVVELDLPSMNEAIGTSSQLATAMLLSRGHAKVFGENAFELDIPALSAKIEGAELDRPLFRVLAAGWSSTAALHRSSTDRDTRRRALIDHWIERKVGGTVWGGATDDVRSQWRSEYEKWASLQRSANVGAVVFDYDGTICEADERVSGPGTSVAAALVRLLEMGLRLGVASGRGRLLFEALRPLLPEKHWERVSVGPYNGALVMSLADSLPDRLRPLDLMREVARIFKASPVVTAVAKVSYAGEMQVTLIETRPLPEGTLRRMALETLASEPEIFDAVTVHWSGVTVDVIGRGASKRRVVDHLAAQINAGSPSEVLQVFAIGDQGTVNGNDFSLLSHSHSLSVLKVSSLLDRCWNLARPGRRGSVAFVDYLDAIVPNKAGGDTVTFDIDSLESA